MATIVDVKGQGKVEFPDGISKSQILDILRSKFSSDANKYIGAGEALGTIGSSVVAEPVSGLAGIAGALLPGEEGQGARWVKATQDALTYQPRTEMGQKTIGAIGETLAPIGEIIDGASKKLGDKAYAATGSPALAAAAYSAPTALMEGLGVKGFNIARKPVSKENLFAIRSGFGMVDEAKPSKQILYHGSNVEFDKFDPARVGDRLTSLGLGHYLTPNKEMAKQYGENLMKFEVDTSNFLDWGNITKDQRKTIESELMKNIPPERISHFGGQKYKILKRGKEGAEEFKKLKEQTSGAYNDYAKARVLDDDDIYNIDPKIFDSLEPDDIVVGWREGGDLAGANNQQLMTLMNEFRPDLAKELGFKGSVFSDQVAIYDPEIAKRVK
jgi:hypothetical protein